MDNTFLNSDENFQAFEKVNDVIVNIMFCAASKDYVAIKPKDNKEFFYTISCIELEMNKSYFISAKIFKKTKRKNKFGSYLKLITLSTELIYDIKDANSYVNNFIQSFSLHERAICHFNDKVENIRAGDALILINDWEKSVSEFFNERSTS